MEKTGSFKKKQYVIILFVKKLKAIYDYIYVYISFIVIAAY